MEVIRLRVGAPRQVVPDTLAFCWTLVRDQQDMPEAELELELVPAAVRCPACDR